MQANVTDGFLTRGNGVWTHAFDLRARSETAFALNVSLGLFADNTADEICLKNLDFRKKGN